MWESGASGKVRYGSIADESRSAETGHQGSRHKLARTHALIFLDGELRPRTGTGLQPAAMDRSDYRVCPPALERHAAHPAHVRAMINALDDLRPTFERPHHGEPRGAQLHAFHFPRRCAVGATNEHCFGVLQLRRCGGIAHATTSKRGAYSDYSSRDQRYCQGAHYHRTDGMPCLSAAQVVHVSALGRKRSLTAVPKADPTLPVQAPGPPVSFPSRP